MSTPRRLRRREKRILMHIRHVSEPFTRTPGVWRLSNARSRLWQGDKAVTDQVLVARWSGRIYGPPGRQAKYHLSAYRARETLKPPTRTDTSGSNKTRREAR